MGWQADADFERIFSEVLLRFVDARAGRVDAEIRAAQSVFCEFFDIDRSAVWEVVPGPPVGLRLRHLWNADSDAPHLDAATGLAVDGEELVFPIGEGITPPRFDVDGAVLFPWMTQRASSGVTVEVERLEDLPVEAAVDASWLRHYNTRSTVVVPMKFGGVVTGLLTFATTECERAWPGDQVARFEFVARLFAAALGRREAEDKLHGSEIRLDLVSVAAGAGFWELEARTSQIRANPEGRSLYGVPPDEALTLDRILETIHPEDRERVRQRVLGTLGSGAEFVDEYRVVLPGGGVRWVSVRGRGTGVQGANIPPARIVGLALDVTERKHAELDSRAAATRMLTAVDVAGLGFYHMSRLGDVYVLDFRSRELLGLPAERTSRIREFWLDHVHIDDREQLLALGRELVSGHVDGAIREYRYLHDQRGVMWLRHSTRAISEGDASSGLEIVGVFQDITQDRQREDSLRKVLADVERLQEQLRRENVSLREEVRSLKGFPDIRGNSTAIRRALTQVERVASTSSTVMLLGETGTGKERFAEAIHARSPRRDRRMVRVNCAAIPTTLIESELFGREKGAYTGALSNQAGRFELAHGSTLFLDEIAELPLDVQTKLLRVVEERTVQRLGSARPVPVDVRIITATNRDLEKAVREGTFREDLFYRLNVFPITVPPLRARLEDIPLLVKALVEELSAGVGKRFDSIDHRDLDALVAYEWPGNVRELRNTIERAMIVSPGPRLRIPLPGAATERAVPAQSLEHMERAHITAVLQESGWRVSGPHGAAKILGLRPTTLEHRMKKLGIARPGHSAEP